MFCFSQKPVHLGVRGVAEAVLYVDANVDADADADVNAGVGVGVGADGGAKMLIAATG